MGFTLFLTQQFKMTKENRERLYKHFRNLEKTYEALPHLNKGPTATATVRKRAKESADEILSKHPELEATMEEQPTTEEPQEETLEEPVEEKKKTKSRVKKNG